MAGSAREALQSFQAFVIRGREDGGLIPLALRDPAGDEIRIKVAFVGICGSDLHYYFHGKNGDFVIQEPLIPGHEVSGIVDLDPAGEFPSGTAVAIFPAQPGTMIPGLEDRPHLWSGVRYLGSAATTPHTQGAMAEYIYVKREMIRILPKDVSTKSGALAEPLAVALHGVKLAGELRGKNVLISGSGPIGLLALVAANSMGAAELTATDVVPGALERAQRMGAHRVINVADATLPPDRFDVVIECSGSPQALNGAISAVQRGGVIVQVGMIGGGAQAIDIGRVVTKELRLLGAFRFLDEMDVAIQLLQSHPELAECISHTFTLSEIEEAFQVAQNAQLSGKVLVAL